MEIERNISIGDFVTFKVKHSKLGLKFIRRKVIEVLGDGNIIVRGSKKDDRITIKNTDIIRSVMRAGE